MDVARGREAVIDRKAVKRFTVRSDGWGLVYLGGHMAALLLTGALVWQCRASALLLPTILLHGFVMCFLFAPVHECAHATPFRTRWLNEGAYWLLCLVYLVPPDVFRHSHLAHHRYTQIRGRDPDMVLPRQATLGDYLWYVSGIPFWRRNFLWLILHAMGRIEPVQVYFLPRQRHRRMFREARVTLAVYAVILAGAAAAGEWSAPLILWLLPRFLGEPCMRWMRIAEHGECAEGPDLRRNTRTTRAPAWLRALFWNMSYHAEHHLVPAVPFHALPALHAAVGSRLHPVAEGYFAVHGTALAALRAQGGVTWGQPAE